jgi:hypothetical protein
LLESHSIIRASTGWGLLLCNGGFVLPAALGSDWITRLFISALLRPGVGVMDGEFLKQRAEHCRFSPRRLTRSSSDDCWIWL